MATKLSPEQERQFQDWYANISQQYRLNPNPDDPRHYYDYRGAWKEGFREPDETGHWPSRFKQKGHPRMIVGGVNTKTGEPVKEQFGKVNPFTHRTVRGLKSVGLATDVPPEEKGGALKQFFRIAKEKPEEKLEEEEEVKKKAVENITKKEPSMLQKLMNRAKEAFQPSKPPPPPVKPYEEMSEEEKKELVNEFLKVPKLED